MTPTTQSAPPESLEQSISRLADAVGLLHPSRTHRAHDVGLVRIELPRMARMDLHTFAALVRLPAANEQVMATCNHCTAQIECRRIDAPFVACDACIEKHEHDEKMKRHQAYWEKVCPERFRKTELAHAAFPKAIWKQVRADYDANPKQSLFLYGPPRTCKTRVGMLLLKRALIHDQRVGVLWPEELAGLKSNFDGKGTFDLYAGYDLLLLDDALLSACRESKQVDAVKQLIDVRMRHERPFIVTSQIGTEAELMEGKEYKAAKGADAERIKALLGRLREECKVVNFGEAKPVGTEGVF